MFNTSSRPLNFHLLPSFINQSYSDGVNLTPVAGLHYVLWLFDKTESVLIDAASTPEGQLEVVRESVRSHDDRIAYLEHDHSQLQHDYSLKAAIDGEFADWMENKANEDWFNVQGLPRITSESSQAWQTQVKKQVRDLIKTVQQANKVHFSFEILYVVNPIRFRTSGPTCYNVHLGSVESSRRLRELYSGFFRQNNPVRLPSSLKGVSLRVMLTLNSRVRLAIMRQLGANFKASNPGGSFKVRGHDPRPTMIIFPPAKAANSRPRTLNFVQAATSLPSNFNDESLILIYQANGQNNRGKLRQLFVVLNDDDHDRCLEMVKDHHDKRRAGGGSGSRDLRGHSGTVSGSGAGMEVSARSEVIELLRKPPPQPPKTPGESPTGGKGGSAVDGDDRARDSLKRRRESESPKKHSHRSRHHSSSSSSSDSGSSGSRSSRSSSSSPPRRSSRKKKKKEKSRGKRK